MTEQTKLTRELAEVLLQLMSERQEIEEEFDGIDELLVVVETLS